MYDQTWPSTPGGPGDQQTSGETRTTGGTKPRPRWLVPAIATAMAIPLLCGGGFAIGSAASSAGEPEPRTVVETETVTETIHIDPSEERAAELDEREEELDGRAADLDARESDLQEWEDSLTETEAEIEAGTIPGDGIWVVGGEVEPGVYRAEGSGGQCYWSRLGSLDGTDIITNHFGSANVTVEIHVSDAAFETAGCGTWRRQ